VKIRPAGIADAAAIATVHVRTWQQCYRGIVPDDYLDGLSIQRREEQWREALASGTTEVWVAESSTGVVGWIAFDASRDPDAEPSTGELQAVYVSPERWSSGIGRELWLKARARLAERGFARATLWVLRDNARAIRFYREAGFGPSLEKPITIGGNELIEVRYEVALGSGETTAAS
jgi:ribosomal protein S18 acetylase RimI-like enzyme